MSSSESEDEDYDVFEGQEVRERRYPVHDACEFEDIDTLRVSPAEICTRVHECRQICLALWVPECAERGAVAPHFEKTNIKQL